jgi:acyl-[acyl-carrier-protein] desaturase
MSFAEAVYREYMTFFEHAERKRRWSVFDDVPWDLIDRCPRDPELALIAETFCGVELYLPDYVSEGIQLVRANFGQAWFMANWGYEESKHGLALREYLLRTGQRTLPQLLEYERQLYEHRWTLPFATPQQITIYGAIQELTTFHIYKKHEALATQRGDALLAAIYALIARDEMAHSRFYEKVTTLLLDENPDSVKADLVYVSHHFRMPASDLVPGYAQRSEAVRQADGDRGTYLREVWFPFLKRLGLTRHDLPRLPRPARPAETPDGAR